MTAPASKTLQEVSHGKKFSGPSISLEMYEPSAVGLRLRFGLHLWVPSVVKMWLRHVVVLWSLHDVAKLSRRSLPNMLYHRNNVDQKKQMK